MDKTDPICGMKGHIKAHDHYFCSTNCIAKYEKKNKLKPEEKLTTKKWFKPTLYILITAILIVFTIFLQRTGYMILFMGIFFIVVSLLKFANWKGFANSFSMYDIIAKRSKLYSYAYPLIELGLGFAYILKWQITTAAIITFIIMVVGSIGVGKNLLAKNPVQCACLGTLIKIPLTKFTFFEDILMAVMALMVLFL